MRKPGVRHHAVVGPHRLALDVPRPVEHLEGPRRQPRAGPGERLAQLRGLDDRRRVGDQDPARRAASPRRGAPPATARAGRARPGRGAARRCPRSSPAAPPGSARARRRRGTSGRCRGPGWRSPRAARSRRCRRRRAAWPSTARPSPRRDSSTRTPGAMSASTRIGAEVLRVDDLRAARHLDHEVLERRAQHGVRPRRGWPCTTMPSVWPMSSAWGKKPAWVWNSPPSFRVAR